MKKTFSQFIVSIFLGLTAAAVVVSAVMPQICISDFSLVHEFEKDCESENESEKEDDQKEEFGKWMVTAAPESFILPCFASHLIPKTRHGYLEFFTPPPEC